MQGEVKAIIVKPRCPDGPYKYFIEIGLNATKRQLIEALDKVPDDATINMVIDDTLHGGYGALVFEGGGYESKSRG